MKYLTFIGLSLACLFGMAYADEEQVPNRNMPQTTAPFVDFGMTGFIYKKRRYDAPIKTKRIVRKRFGKRVASPATKMTSYPNAGEGTFFIPSRGSCGWKNTQHDLIVAVNAYDMGDKSCGKTIEIVNGAGDKVRAKVVDTCPKCEKGDLGLSPAAFAKLASIDQGKVNIHWKYLD